MGDDKNNNEIDKNIYDEKKLIKVNKLYDFDGIFWDIFFNNINRRYIKK